MATHQTNAQRETVTTELDSPSEMCEARSEHKRNMLMGASSGSRARSADPRAFKWLNGRTFCNPLMSASAAAIAEQQSTPMSEFLHCRSGSNK